MHAGTLCLRCLVAPLLLLLACGGEPAPPSPVTQGLPAHPQAATKPAGTLPVTGANSAPKAAAAPSTPAAPTPAAPTAPTVAQPAPTPAAPTVAALAPTPAAPAVAHPSSGDPALDALLEAGLAPHVADRARFRDAPRYRIDVTVDLDLHTYQGQQTLTYTNTEGRPLRELVFLVYPNSRELRGDDADNLTITSATVDGRAATPTLSGPVLRLPLPAPLAPGAKATAVLDFKARIFRLPSGSGDVDKQAIEQLIGLLGAGEARGPSGGFGVFGYGEGVVSLGLWYPILAAHDERGWDLLAPGGGSDDGAVGDVSYFDVAHYDVRITTDRAAAVVTSGVAQGPPSPPSAAGLSTRRFVAAAVREFTVQLSRDLQSAEARAGGARVRSWFRPKHREVGQRVADHAAAAMRFYEQRFGPYPYPELDVVEAPLIGGAGGVEFPGLVTIAAMFYGPGGRVGTPNPLLGGVMTHRFMRETLEFVVAHEVAHEWWNAVVGSDSKRHPFVDEALANHSALLYFEHMHGLEAAERQRELQVRMSYQVAMMAGGKDRPVDLPTSAFTNMLEYAGIVYGKGALFLDAMRSHAGAAAHGRALAQYYARHAFGIARPDDLVDALVGASRDRPAARRLAKRWLHETHGAEDIGSISLTSLMRYLAPEAQLDAQTLAFLEDEGLQEFGKLLNQLISPDGHLREDVDYGAMVRTVGKLVSDGDEDIAVLFRVIGGLMSAGNPLDPANAPQLMKVLGDEIAGDNPELRALLQAAGQLMKAADSMADRPAPAPHPTRRSPKGGP